MQDRPVVIAVDVGGTVIKGCAVTSDGTEVLRLDRASEAEHGAEKVLANLDALIESLLASTRAEYDIAALSVVVLGLVDPTSGVALYSANAGWRDVPLAARLRERFGLVVVLDHDVRAAGLAELTRGALTGTGDGLYVSLGTGVAAAVVVGGQVLAGPTGMAGELGHVPVFPDGDKCACGQFGCLEAYASAAALVRRYAVQAPGAELDSAEIVRRAVGGEDSIAVRIWDDALTALARGIVTSTMLLDPTRVVIGGGLAQAGDGLFEPLRHRVAAGLAWRGSPEIVPAHFGSDAGRVGAALLGWRAVTGES